MSDHHYARPSRLEAAHYRDPDCVFHLVLRAFTGSRPFTGSRAEQTWAALLAERNRDDIEIVAACLMPDHLHLVVRPQSLEIPVWVRLFKGALTRRFRSEGYGRRPWQPRYWGRLVRDDREFAILLQYVRENPLRAGLVDSVEEWPWLLLPDD